MQDPQHITADYYDKNAARWASLKNNSFFHESQFRKFVKYFRNGNRILDIGCAYGIHAPLFLGIGRHLRYEGMDISRRMAKLAKSRYPQLSFSVRDISYRKGLQKNRYDGFWAAAVLMHIPEKDWDATLANIERIIKKGGIGYVTLPFKRPNPVRRNDKRPFLLFKRRKFRNIVAPRGWKILHSGVMDGNHKNRNWRWFIVRLPKK